MEEKKVIYYKNELEDEFSEKKINPIKIDKNYKYSKSPVWDFCSLIMQNILTMPIKLIYLNAKLKIRYIGKEKFKECKHTGYFIYGNHTQSFADTFIPSIANYPKRNFFIVNPENVSMNGLKTFAKLAGAIPIPEDLESYKNFLEHIKKVINKKHSITIYPEAHIWPYYTKIRNFRTVSFSYPVRLNKPVYACTNTYQSYGRNNDKVRIVSYIDGPFIPDQRLHPKEREQELRNIIYNKMVERSKESNIEKIQYIKKEE